MEFTVLETERLKLVEIKEGHLDSVFAIFSDAAVTEFYGMSPFTEKEQAQKMIQSFAKRFHDKQSIRWGIIWKETETFVGTVGLNNLSLANKRTEIGYDLLPAYWRKGIVSEAVKEVIHYCFTELDLHRIGAITFPENEASSNLLLKMGFQKEGFLRGYLQQNGHANDVFLFSLIKTDWQK